MKTTPPPRKDVTAVVPELKAAALTTVRLHPRREAGLGAAESKIGGLFLWPQDEPWPICESTEPPEWAAASWDIPEEAEVEMTPVLQLAAKDFPEVEFRPGTDLMQLLWAPFDHPAMIFVAKPYIWWRNSKEVRKPRKSIPKSEYANPSYVPPECRLHPERVVEYPAYAHGQLADEIVARLEAWDASDVFDEEIQSSMELYAAELSAAPGTKVGGYVRWIQDPEVPKCDKGHAMTHLLTLSDQEFDRTTKARWCPTEDRAIYDSEDEDDETYKAQTLIRHSAFRNLGGSQYIFICRKCPDWPIASVFQR